MADEGADLVDEQQEFLHGSARYQLLQLVTHEYQGRHSKKNTIRVNRMVFVLA